jgi:hypothetical protein
VSHEIPPGGVLVLGGAGQPAGVPITSVAIVATASAGEGAKRFGYFVFGDPEPAP